MIDNILNHQDVGLIVLNELELAIESKKRFRALVQTVLGKDKYQDGVGSFISLTNLKALVINLEMAEMDGILFCTGMDQQENIESILTFLKFKNNETYEYSSGEIYWINPNEENSKCNLELKSKSNFFGGPFCGGIITCIPLNKK